MEPVKKNTPITEWAEDDRPREKLLLKGKAALSNAELIAILLGSGNTEQSAVQLAQEILDASENNLIELSKKSVNELMKFKGMGPAKAVSIVAALELGKRRVSEKALEKKAIRSSKDVYDYLYSELTDQYYEHFFVLLLDRSNRIIKKLNIAAGGVSGVTVDVKKVFKEAIAHNASSVILAHNHPSNNMKPSEQDKNLTKKIAQAGKVIDIQVLDHIIVGNDRYFSFADEGLM